MISLSISLRSSTALAGAIVSAATPLAPLYTLPVEVPESAKPGDVVTTFTPQPNTESGLPLTISLESDPSGYFELNAQENLLSNAADFNGTDEYLYRTEGLIGGAAITQLLFSGWIKLTDNATTQTIYMNCSSTEANRGFYIKSEYGNNRLILSALNTSAVESAYFTYPDHLQDGQWHHILYSVDVTNASAGQLYIDDVAAVGAAFGGSGSNIRAARPVHRIGQTVTNTQWVLGNMAHLLWYEDNPDLSVEANRRLFITASGAPAPNQADLSPIFYMPLNEVGNYGANAGTGGDFTVIGDLTGAPLPADGDYDLVVSEDAVETVVEDAFDITTYSATGVALVAGNSSGEIRGIFWKPDGLRVYWVYKDDNAIRYSDLTTPWDLSTAGAYQVSTYSNTHLGSAEDITFKSDGTVMYLARGIDIIYEYPLTTPWDVDTLQTPTARVINPGLYDWRGIHFSSDGTKVYLFEDGTIRERTLTTPWDLTVYNATGSYVVSGTAQGRGLSASDDGKEFFASSWLNEGVYQVSLSTGWDLNSVSGTVTETIADGNTIAAVCYNDIGSKMYIMYQGSPYSLYEYDIGSTTQQSHLEAGETYPITVRTTEASEGKTQEEAVSVGVTT